MVTAAFLIGYAWPPAPGPSDHRGETTVPRRAGQPSDPTPQDILRAVESQLAASRRGVLEICVTVDGALPADPVPLRVAGGNGSSFEVTTDEDGCCSAPVRYPETYSVTSAAPLLRGRARLPVVRAREKVDVALHSVGIVDVTVASTRGPVADAAVFATLDGREDLPDLRTDPDGRARVVVPGDDPSRLRLGAAKIGLLPAERTVDVRPGRRTAATLTLTPCAVIEARLAGAPPGTTVRLATWRRIPVTKRNDLDWVAHHRRATRFTVGDLGSDTVVETIATSVPLSDGRLRCSSIMPGPGGAQVLIEFPDRPPKRLVLRAADLSGPTLDLGEIECGGPAAPVHVQLLDAETNEALSGAEVLFQSIDVPAELQVNTDWVKADRHGVVRTPQVRSGSYYRVFVKSIPFATILHLDNVLVSSGNPILVPRRSGRR